MYVWSSRWTRRSAWPPFSRSSSRLRICSSLRSSMLVKPYDGATYSRRALVSCHRSSLTKSGDASEDLVGGLDPQERLGRVVAGGQVEPNRVFELSDACVSATSKLLVGKHREPALDLIDPGAIGRREVDVEAGVAKQPPLDERRLVGAVVVHNEVDIESVGQFSIDAVEKALELDGAVATMGLADDRAGGHVESGEKRGGAVTTVVVSPTLSDSRGQRQDRLSSVQSLDLALLIDAKDQCPIGRIQIQADDIADLFDELGIVGEFEGFDAMRLESKGVPDARDRGIADSRPGGQGAGAPMGRVLGHGFQSGGHNLLDLLVAEGARSTGAGFVQESGQTTLHETLAPFPDGGIGEAEVMRDLTAGMAIRTAQDDARALGQSVAGLGAFGPAQELIAIAGGDVEDGLVGTAAWHGVDLIVAAAGYPTIISRTSVTGH